MEENEDNIVQQTVSRFLPYWPLFMLGMVIALIGTSVYLHFATPIYEATATLIIKDEKKGDEESKLLESLDQLSSKKIVENEIEILQSRKLMENVVTALGLYAPVYKKGNFHDILAYKTSPVSVIALHPESLPTVKKVTIHYDEKNRQVTLNQQFKYPLDRFVTTPFGELKFVGNKYYSGSEASPNQLFFSLNRPKVIAALFKDGLKAEASGKLSSVVNLNYRDQSPARAEDILNGLINAYQESANAEKDALASNTLSFVNDRLGIVSHDLDSIEKKIQQYKSGNQAVDISAQGQLFLKNVSDNDQKLGEVNSQIAVLNEVENFVKSKDNSSGGIVPSTLGISDPMLNGLIEKLYTSELEYDKLRKTVGENNPELVSLAERINKIKPGILDNIQSQRQSLNATRQNINSTNGLYNSMLQSVPRKERRLLDISREQQLKSNLYAFLLQKSEESKMAYASAAANSRIVDYAQAGPKPVTPKKGLMYLIAIVLVMGLCVALLFIKELINGKVLYRKELESGTSIPIVGEIMYEKLGHSIVTQKGQRSLIAEEFRKLRISLSFLGINAAHKKILVTSGISGEGKSFIAANLAVSLAATGKKVVIVDLDLNKPTLHQLLNVNCTDGVTQFLSGEKDAGEIIKKVEEYDNLYFIAAGTSLPENPSELLSNGKVNELIQYLNDCYDVVVIDTSPLALVTDAYILTGLCDATLYVVRHQYTPKVIVKRLDENNRINPIYNPAIIFNGVKKRGFFRNNYGYGYNYVYGNRESRKERNKLVVKY